MSSNLKVNSIIPSTGGDVGLGTAGGTITARCPIVGIATFTGDLTIDNKIVHAGDLDTSLSFTTNTISLQTAGTEWLQVASDGKILLAGASSYHADADDLVLKERSGGNVGMTFQNSGTGYGVIYFADSGAQHSGRIQYDHSNDSLDLFAGGGEVLSMNDNGLVTGNQTNPTSSDNGNIYIKNGSSIGGVSHAVNYVSNAVFNSAWKYITSSVGATRIVVNQNGFKFDTAGSGTAGNNITFSNRLHIKSDGKIGIGGASNDAPGSPDGNLHIQTSSAGSVNADADANELVLESGGTAAKTGMSILSPGDGESSIYFGNPGTNGQKDSWIKYYHETHATVANRRALTFRIAQTERLRIDSTGTLITGNHTNNALAVHDGSSRGLNLTQTGRIYCKTDDHWDFNRPGGGLMQRFRNGNDNGGGATQTVVGNITINSSSVSFNTTQSDSRLKKNIVSWTDEVLPNFKTLQPKKFHFNWQSDEDSLDTGYVAQDLVGAFPEAYQLCKTEVDGEEVDRYSFNPSGMVKYLMKAVQEEIAKREALEARIAALESS